MQSLFTFVSEPSRCGYLADQVWSQEYEHVAALSAAEYEERMRVGWRHFGHMLFRPHCPTCRACRSLRVPVAAFRPDRSQRRAWKANVDSVRLEIVEPSVSAEKLRLYDRFHAYQSDAKGWPLHPAKDHESYIESFVFNPFPSEEWNYFVGDDLVGVGFVDPVPEGLSAVYFFYEPAQRQRSLGTYNVLCILEAARRRGVPYVYLGYFVAGCRSLEYKARFAPNEALGADGAWHPFRP